MMTATPGAAPNEWTVTDGEHLWTVVCRPDDSTAEAAIAIVTDVTKPPTDKELEAARLAARVEAIKAECRRVIFSMVDETAQMNMASFAGAGLFTAGDLATYRAGLNWVGAMQMECRRAIAEGDDPAWPDLPEGVAELVARF